MGIIIALIGICAVAMLGYYFIILIKGDNE